MPNCLSPVYPALFGLDDLATFRRMRPASLSAEVPLHIHNHGAYDLDSLPYLGFGHIELLGPVPQLVWLMDIDFQAVFRLSDFQVVGHGSSLG